MKTDETQGAYATKAKTIFRTVKNEDHPFVMIDRRPVENPDLSWGAKGLLSYLLSRPDNWTVRLRDLVNRSSDGSSKIRGYIKELVKAGHAHRVAHKDPETHRIIEWVLEVYELPFAPKATPPVSIGVESHLVENRTLNDTDLINDTDLKDIKTLGAEAPNPPNIPASFGVDWQIGAGVDKVVIPENDTTHDKASSWAALIAMNNADLEPLALEFMVSANKLPTDSDIKYWRKVFRKFRNYSARPASADDVRRAVIKHIAAKLPIKSPASIEWALIEIVSPTPEAQEKTEPEQFDSIRRWVQKKQQEQVNG